MIKSLVWISVCDTLASLEGLMRNLTPEGGTPELRLWQDIDAATSRYIEAVKAREPCRECHMIGGHCLDCSLSVLCVPFEFWCSTRRALDPCKECHMIGGHKMDCSRPRVP